MTDALEQISGLLHEAGETHHRVFRIVDGADNDWASWYAQWLIDLSELPDLLGARPVRSELIYLLVSLNSNTRPRLPGNLGRPTTRGRFCAISGHQAGDTAAYAGRPGPAPVPGHARQVGNG